MTVGFLAGICTYLALGMVLEAVVRAEKHSPEAMVPIFFGAACAGAAGVLWRLP